MSTESSPKSGASRTPPPNHHTSHHTSHQTSHQASHQTTPKRSDPVSRQRDAYNAHDLAAFLACYAADVIVYDNEGRITAQNRVDMAASYKTLFARSPRVRARVRQRIQLGPSDRYVVIDEEHVSGYVSGGAEKRFVLAVMYEVEGDLIRLVRFLTPPYPKAPREAAP